MLVFLVYVLMGCVASFLSGLLGIGGGLLIIPALLYVFTQFQVVGPLDAMHMVVGTSLASAIVNLFFSVKAHHEKGAVDWSIFIKMTPGVVVGAFLFGPMIMRVMTGPHLKIFFGIFCLLMALQMIFQKAKKASAAERIPGSITLSFLGLCVGTLSTLLGIAGGALVGVILNFYRLNMRKVVGTSAAIAMAIAVAGTLGLVFISAPAVNLPRWSTGFVYWPAFLGIALPSLFITQLGARCAHKISVDMLRKLFAAVVLLVGVEMLF